jgi:hypothetical protein
MARRMRAVKSGARPINLDAINRARDVPTSRAQARLFVQKIGPVAVPCATQVGGRRGEMDSKVDLC